LIRRVVFKDCEQKLELDYASLSISSISILKILHTYVNCIHIKNVFLPKEVADTNKYLQSIPFVQIGAWLGAFKYYQYNINYNTSQKGKITLVPTPTPNHIVNNHIVDYEYDLSFLTDHISKLVTMVPELNFTNGWVQCYTKGGHVHPHTDPSSHNGCVVIAIFGTFEGGNLCVGRHTLKPQPGDVVLLRGYNKKTKLPMPLHSVTPVTTGTRYSIILNCIR